MSTSNPNSKSHPQQPHQNNTQQHHLDMSCHIGGRTVKPHFNVVDGSFPSSPSERSFNKRLLHFTTNQIPLESDQNMKIRERALNQIGSICRNWIQYVCQKMELPEEIKSVAGGQIFTSGSFRLGVHEPGADIDTILVAPNMCTKEDFFGNHYTPPGNLYNKNEDLTHLRDPNSLAERIRRHPDVTNFNPVESAVVPLLTFDWEGINIDLLFARLNSTSVPSNFDIDYDSVLDGVDSATEKSLNGPRVTNLIYALVSGTKERYQTFLTTVRCVRKWAKARGLYSNKMGYWGGVNINISVALVVQLYPNACPATLLRRFFLVFKSWRWPTPVLLTKPHDAELGLQVWSQFSVHNARQVAPIITPAYPAMNSSLSISRQTLQILHEEICRGHDIMDKIWKKHHATFTKNPHDVNLENGDDFAEIFEPSDFYISYPHYLSLCIVGPTQPDLQSWAGFVESRLRKLVSDLLGKSLPLSKLQLWPKKLDACCADKLALLTPMQRRNSLTYFIGFKIDQMRMRGNQLNIEQQIQNFKREDLSRFHPLVNGMDVLVRTFKVKELPRILFENQYESFGGGKEGAMKKRRKLRDSDPQLVMKKKKAKVEAELKAKRKEMERRIQKKKEEMEKLRGNSAFAATGNNDEEMLGINAKEDIEIENTNDAKPKEGNSSVVESSTEGAVIKDEEEALLELALDSIQNDTGGKTREEAELDRKKLLAGELLEEGGGGDNENVDDLNVDDSKNEDVKKKTLTEAEMQAEILKSVGYTVVSDDECTLLGATSMKLRFGDVKADETEADFKSRMLKERRTFPSPPKKVTVVFRTNFDVVELDAQGMVIDKGDEDFTPSKSWIGRKGGFEFKLGERGLGYYRTGKKVVVPSNVSY